MINLYQTLSLGISITQTSFSLRYSALELLSTFDLSIFAQLFDGTTAPDMPGYEREE
jgi:hypothetical protein